MSGRPARSTRYRIAQFAGWAMLLGVVTLIVSAALPKRETCTPESVTNLGKTVFAAPPCVTLDDGPLYEAVFETSEGSFAVLLEPRIARTTVNHFVFLARNGFYNGSEFHRIVDAKSHAYLQAGDRPGGDGKGTAGYFYDGEPPSPQTTYLRGVIAMVDYRADDEITGDGSPPKNGSQFFIVVRDWDEIGTPNEFPRFTVFGRVFDPESLYVLDGLVSFGSPKGIPLLPVVIDRITIRVIDRFDEQPSPSPSPDR